MEHLRLTSDAYSLLTSSEGSIHNATCEASSTAVMDSTDFDRVRRLLYTSHILSTWNSRAFEFGAFLFLAAIYPQTLLPASLYALWRAFSAVLLSPIIGRIIDKSDRLVVVRLSIGKPNRRGSKLSSLLTLRSSSALCSRGFLHFAVLHDPLPISSWSPRFRSGWSRMSLHTR